MAQSYQLCARMELIALLVQYNLLHVVLVTIAQLSPPNKFLAQQVFTVQEEASGCLNARITLIVLNLLLCQLSAHQEHLELE